MGSRVELYSEIRRAARVEGLSVSALAKRFRVHRRTIRQALASPVPPERKVPQRRAPKLGEFQSLIDDWLRELVSCQGALVAVCHEASVAL